MTMLHFTGLMLKCEFVTDCVKFTLIDELYCKLSAAATACMADIVVSYKFIYSIS